MTPWILMLATALAADDPYVLVLGVAQDAGHPQAGCDKVCCRAAWNDPSLRHRASSVAVVDPKSGERWLLDATPDLVEQLHVLHEASPGPLTGIFLTHAHIGHYTGLMHLGPEAMGADGIPVYAMPRMRDFLRAHEPWATVVRNGNVALRDLADAQEVELNDRLVITPVQVPHRDELSETVGFWVRGPKGSVLYLPDIDKWDRWSTAVETWIDQVDVALLDGTFFADGELEGRDMSQIPHPFIADTMARLAPLPPDKRARVRFIHLNHTNPALDPNGQANRQVEEAGFRVAREGERYPL